MFQSALVISLPPKISLSRVDLTAKLVLRLPILPNPFAGILARLRPVYASATACAMPLPAGHGLDCMLNIRKSHVIKSICKVWDGITLTRYIHVPRSEQHNSKFRATISIPVEPSNCDDNPPFKLALRPKIYSHPHGRFLCCLLFFRLSMLPSFCSFQDKPTRSDSPRLVCSRVCSLNASFQSQYAAISSLKQPCL